MSCCHANECSTILMTCSPFQAMIHLDLEQNKIRLQENVSIGLIYHEKINEENDVSLSVVSLERKYRQRNYIQNHV